MTRDEPQAALDQWEGTHLNDIEYRAARSWLRLLPQNGQWNEATINKCCTVLMRTMEDDWLFIDLARAVLSALTEEG
jgi:D-serine deaminase-like pyridoxal phosphate-dependent protein